MNIRGIVAGVVAGLVVGGSGMVAYANPGAGSVNLRCETVDECHQTIDVLYSDVQTLGKSTADLQKINEAQAERIQQLEARVVKKRARW